MDVGDESSEDDLDDLGRYLEAAREEGNQDVKQQSEEEMQQQARLAGLTLAMPPPPPPRSTPPPGHALLSEDDPKVWMNEINKKIYHPPLTCKSETYDPSDPYWQFTLGSWALDKVQKHIEKYDPTDQEPELQIPDASTHPPPKQTTSDIPIDLTSEYHRTIDMAPFQLTPEESMRVEETRLAWVQNGEFDMHANSKSSAEYFERATRYIDNPTADDIDTASFNDGLTDLAFLGSEDLAPAKEAIGMDPRSLVLRMSGMTPGYKLYPHQVIGVARLVQSFEDRRTQGHLVCDDVGLGKSVEATALLLYVSCHTILSSGSKRC